MKIEKRGEYKKFYEVARGEVFEFDDKIFIKVRDYCDINSVALLTGNLYNIDSEQVVIIFGNAKVVIE